VTQYTSARAAEFASKANVGATRAGAAPTAAIGTASFECTVIAGCVPARRPVHLLRWLDWPVVRHARVRAQLLEQLREARRVPV